MARRDRKKRRERSRVSRIVPRRTRLLRELRENLQRIRVAVEKEKREGIPTAGAK